VELTTKNDSLTHQMAADKLQAIDAIRIKESMIESLTN
jgi:hypothetical protein